MLVHLWPYIWPSNRADLKARVLFATVLIFAAKLATITVPFTFKWATDALAGHGTAPIGPNDWLVWVLVTPVAMTLAYGGTRILMGVLTQWRDGIFAKVAMNAVRQLAMLTFEHMHLLSLRFHLERKTGGLTRILERGRNAIETIVRMLLLQLLPTIVEVVLVGWVLLFHFDWRYLVVILLTVALYVGFTFYATEWRINIRRSMNESDTDANAKAIDSLLNYETVKYFSAEEREAKRYDRSMERYEVASVKAYTSLAVLNAGQAIVFTIGLSAAMVLCAYGIAAGTNTVGDFVMINAMMIQLYQPLNFMGLVYREIKQAIIDIEIMFSMLQRQPEIEDRPDARPLQVRTGAIRFENVSFAYEPARPILKGLSFEVAAGRTVAIVGPSGAGKSTISRLLFRFYDVTGGRILDRRPRYPRRHADVAARRDRHGSAGHRAVQRHDPLQHPLRPLGCDRRRSGGGGADGADRRLYPPGAERLRNRGRRAWPEAFRRREAARRHRPHHPQGAADPPPRRGHLRARQPYRARHSGCARPRVEEPHHVGHRASALDHRRRR